VVGFTRRAVSVWLSLGLHLPPLHLVLLCYTLPCKLDTRVRPRAFAASRTTACSSGIGTIGFQTAAPLCDGSLAAPTADSKRTNGSRWGGANLDGHRGEPCPGDFDMQRSRVRPLHLHRQVLHQVCAVHRAPGVSGETKAPKCVAGTHLRVAWACAP
jgi:hypothetical protein